MSTHVEETVRQNVLEVRLTGKLTSEDYPKFVPGSEALIRKFGKIRILAILDQFHGWDAGALWQDIKWDIRHFCHVERLALALVGETKWQEWMASFCKPFTSAEIRYFEHEQLPEARCWSEGSQESSVLRLVPSFR